MLWFALASLTPAVLLVLGCLLGGPWPLLAVLSITVLVFFLDKLGRELLVLRSSGRGLSLILAVVHFPLLYLGIWALAQETSLTLLNKSLLFVGLGLFFGQISNANAHELIHARRRLPRQIGAALYVSLFYGHHVSAHLRVHHVHAATAADPNSAAKGCGFWRYAAALVVNEFRAGWRADTLHRRHLGTPFWSHPYASYLSGAAAALTFSVILAGPAGLLAHLALAAYAALQLMLSDYVQHYGLRRRVAANGKAEPMGPEHSWNAPMWYSSAMLLDAPRHSDHHQRPGQAFPGLTSPQGLPTLPHSLPVMAVLALFPPLWRKVMDPRVTRWQKSASPSGH